MTFCLPGELCGQPVSRRAAGLWGVGNLPDLLLLTCASLLK